MAPMRYVVVSVWAAPRLFWEMGTVHRKRSSQTSRITREYAHRSFPAPVGRGCLIQGVTWCGVPRGAAPTSRTVEEL
ncbi:hypothetical protein PsYK624_046470 [Phanerochaete sordida]|uniref:Uncharacterized protein n=1 Tax=Phanerochaete sordida TaxID=48140 RepID=A0A9P3G6W3_9APHY|nr:hypothetical protein PsYK624_046470 [Phanerochaete sordida]